MLSTVMYSRLTRKWNINHIRFSSSFTSLLSGKLNQDTKFAIEDYWKTRIDHSTSSREKKEKYYVLSMFPYPSGKLHMGHIRVYTISDAMARYQRMHGKEVIHPMGWDAFGLPAENAAIENGVPPNTWTKTNIKNMKEQLSRMTYSFDWEREYATCDPDYYKWTQWIFLKMYEAGLVYRKSATVNWDPIDLTVLADEQIDSENRSWRSGAKVETRFLKQWYVRTTAYSKSLIDGLEDVNADLWRDVVKLQKNWIGNCNGTKLEFRLKTQEGIVGDEPLTVFTSEPELLHGLSYVALSGDHQLSQSESYKGRLNIHAINPVNGCEVPIIICDKTDFPSDTDVKLGIPCSSEFDRSVALENGFSFEDCLDKTNKLQNSCDWNGLTRGEALEAALKHARDNLYGGHLCSARLRDWLISRQRYWGTPIPIIHCTNCGAVPVPLNQLPVSLPEVMSLSSKGHSPLVDSDWSKTSCPKCSAPGRRESDTMDTFVDSSWYYLRYLDSRNSKEAFSLESVQDMPVDLYIGGKEHATLHLYFARFVNHFLHDEGLVPVREPFYNLLTQGMVLGQSCQVKATGKYLRREEVDFSKNPPVEMVTNAELVTSWEKMSKSKYNGTDPEEILNEYGVDSTRLCILGGVAPKSDRKWQSEFFKGIINWQKRIWVLISDYINTKQQSSYSSEAELLEYNSLLFQKRNYYLNEYRYHMEKTFLISFAISRLQVFTNELKKTPKNVMCNSIEFEKSICLLTMMLAPLAPMYASELWSGLRKVENKFTNNQVQVDYSIDVLEQTWPSIDPEYKFPIYVRSGLDKLFTAPILYRNTHNLTENQVLEMIRNDARYEEIKSNVLNSKCEIYPGLRIEVQISLKDSKKKKKKK